MAQPPAPVQLHQMSPPPFSPMGQQPQANGTPQVNAASPSYIASVNKRQRIDSPQPLSPYSAAASPYALSPGTDNNPSTAATSPSYAGQQIPPSYQQQQQQHSAVPSFANGNTTPQQTYIPPPQPHHYQQPLPSPSTSLPQTPSATTPAPPDYPYTTASLSTHPAPVTPGAMGPPSKPAVEEKKSQKEGEFDDVLTGTGINLQDEEAELARMYATSFGPSAKTGLPANTPGDRGSFYGAGPANQPGEDLEALTEEEAIAKAAQDAWDAAAYMLATTRVIELNDPFLETATVFHKAEKIGKEYGLVLNLDLKAPPQVPYGRARDPVNFEKPSVTVRTRTTEAGAVMNTYGAFVPHDAFLVEQLALLSIATKQRVRELMEEADRLSVIRQQTSHGKPGAEWESASAPVAQLNADEMQIDLLRSVGDGVDGADASGATMRKRSYDAHAPTATDIITTLREVGRKERDAEEARLRKRLKRTEAAAAPSAAGTPAPATPGQVAPEPAAAKAGVSKKQKKIDNAKATDLASAANANATMNQFLGGSKKGKKYSWMTGGGSGASTPKRGLLGAGADSRPGTPGVGGAATAAGGGAGGGAEKATLTVEGRNRPGLWREDGLKGKGVQLRDWVAALEEDGKDPRAMQLAYDKLDNSTV